MGAGRQAGAVALEEEERRQGGGRGSFQLSLHGPTLPFLPPSGAARASLTLALPTGLSLAQASATGPQNPQPLSAPSFMPLHCLEHPSCSANFYPHFKAHLQSPLAWASCPDYSPQREDWTLALDADRSLDIALSQPAVGPLQGGLGSEPLGPCMGSSE